MRTASKFGLGLLFGATALCVSGLAQQGTPGGTPSPYQPRPPAAGYGAPVVQYVPGRFYGPFGHQSPRASQFARDYVKAKDAGKKKGILKEMTGILNKEFDAHLKQQEKELADLERQLKELRALVEKRKENKEDIVQDRIKQLLREAEGLGWNAPSTPRPSFTPLLRDGAPRAVPLTKSPPQ
jgi:hypothetical protein